MKIISEPEIIELGPKAFLDQHQHRWLLVALLDTAGCTDTADTSQLNNPTKQLGPKHLSFARTGVDSGPVTITMADGEF